MNTKFHPTLSFRHVNPVRIKNNKLRSQSTQALAFVDMTAENDVNTYKLNNFGWKKDEQIEYKRLYIAKHEKMARK